MKIIMSRALPPNYTAHRLPPNILLSPQQSQNSSAHHQGQSEIRMPHQHPNHVTGSRHSIRRLSSPLDFTDSIPFNELKLSTETLGSGSFGTVFKGRWRSHNVAVKQFKTREEIDSFSVEVKQLSRVKHPNIVKLYGASSPSKSAAYLIMEYAEGGSLNHLLHECRQQEYDLRHACSWALQTARGVAYLHSLRPKPIMHRDLKPANLLLFSRGKILKICDFGTACAVKTQMTNNTGSASYMAPEVFATSSYLESGDVFSWSIIFWEILVRMQPYHGQYSNPFQVLWKVNNGTRPREIDGCPEVIWSLITRSWDKDPNERPTMRQVAQEMETIFSLSRPVDSSSSQISDSTSLSSSRNSQDTTPTNVKDFGSQVHNRCRALVSRILPTSSANIKTSSSSATRTVDETSLAVTTLEETFESNPTLPNPRLDHIQQGQNDVSNQMVVQGYQMHHQHHHYEYISQSKERWSNESFSTNSQPTATTRFRALMRHIELLQVRHDEIQNEISSDRKNSTAESFKEFANLKNDIEKLRHLVKESCRAIHVSPDREQPDIRCDSSSHIARPQINQKS